MARRQHSVRSFTLLATAMLAFLLALAVPLPSTARVISDRTDGISRHDRRMIQARSGTTIQDLTPMPKARFGRGTVPVRGVNLGGWFILEAWQTPSMFLTPDLAGKDIPDEWTWTKTVGNTTAGRKRLQKHYDTWLTADDFKQIAAVGLNTVRLPVPHWAFVSSASEPYFSGLQLPYIAKALTWARDNKLDVVLDLHTVPGSQNSYDNSGKAGTIGFGKSEDNADLAILALMRMTEMFVNDAKYGGVVKAIEVVNEPKVGNKAVPLAFLQEFYRKSYAAIRNTIDTKRAPLVPTIVFSDAFLDLSAWDDFFWDKSWYKKGSYVIDTHSYQAWSPQKELSYSGHIKYACSRAEPLARTKSIHPVIVGEFALGIETRCVPYQICANRTMAQDLATLNSDAQNLFARRFWEAQMQTFENSGSGWIFWSWKGESTAAWSYSAAVQQGWIPRNLSERAFKQQAGPYCVEKNPSIKVGFKTRS